MANELLDELRQRVAGDLSPESPIRRILPNLFTEDASSLGIVTEREVLELIRRVLLVFSEPEFVAVRGVMLDSVGSLLMLLRSKSLEVYRMFFQDAIKAIEDLQPIALLHSSDPGLGQFKCFCMCFSGIRDDPCPTSDLPDTNKPKYGDGLLLNLLGDKRWQTFTICILKLICRSLTEGTHYVENLIHTSFVKASCSFVCSSDKDVQMACFEFASLVGSILSFNILPHEDLIQSIINLLSADDPGLPVYRNAIYDSTIGRCLTTVYLNCSDVIVKQTAESLVLVFLHALRRTNSEELKASLCSAYVRVVKSCPHHILQRHSLLKLLRHQEPCFQLRECLKAVLGPDASHTSADKPFKDINVGQKRHIKDKSTYYSRKRQKTSAGTQQDICLAPEVVDLTDGKDTTSLREMLISTVNSLKPPPDGPETSIAALSILTNAFCLYSWTDIASSLFNQMYVWIRWIAKKQSTTVDISIYLEGIDNILLVPDLHDDTSKEENMKAIQVLLKLPWTQPDLFEKSNSLLKSKCLSVGICAKLHLRESDFGIFDSALSDDSEQVQAVAVISMPLRAFFSDLDVLPHIFQRLKDLSATEHLMVKKTIPQSLGFLSCLYGSSTTVSEKTACHLLLHEDIKKDETLNCLLRGFQCSKCDEFIKRQDEKHFRKIMTPEVGKTELGYQCDHSDLQSLYFRFLLDGSPETQLACVEVIRRILGHVPPDILTQTRTRWISCIEDLLLHENTVIREAFSAQIGIFVQHPILSCLFLDDTGQKNKSCERIFFDLIEDSLRKAKDPHVIQTLLESTAEVMVAVDSTCELFLFSLFLLIDQLDHPNLILRTYASRSIKRSCYVHEKGGFMMLLSRATDIQKKLFDNLSVKLTSRPNVVREFAEAVLGVETKELVGKMVPVVLPKLLVYWEEDAQEANTLNELAKLLDTEKVPLLVNWLPRVLAFALNQKEEKNLLAVLQLHHSLIGFDNKEFFSAALPAILDELVCLPALLDELVCFVDIADTSETDRRIQRLPDAIKKISKVLTDTEDLPGFLQSYFAGLLNSIDRKMLHADNIFLQEQALPRIKVVIEMMGEYLSIHVPKLMVLLMHAIEKDALQSEGLSILHFLTNKMDAKSLSSIKYMISQVFAAFIPFLEREKECPHKVVEILEALVSKNRDIQKQHLCGIPSLPTIPSFVKLNQAIAEARGSMSLKDQLWDIINGMEHENLNVRYMVACELRKLLYRRSEDIADELISDMEILSSLITSLLQNCAEESRTTVGQRFELVYADCLGAIGAIDPAKLRVASCNHFQILFSDDDLIFELIHKHLARAFRAAQDTIIQDSAAFAIQDLLKFAGCTPSLAAIVVPHDISDSSGSEKKKQQGEKLWDRFSDEIKELIAPCLTSNYKLPKVSSPESDLSIHRSSMSFRRWVSNWIKKMTTYSHESSRKIIFEACLGIVYHDMQTATCLLPYLVLDIIGNSSIHKESIKEEILSVLDPAALENSFGVGQSAVCVQAIFTLLDKLGKWVDDVKQRIAGVSTSSSSELSLSSSSESLGESATEDNEHESSGESATEDNEHESSGESATEDNEQEKLRLQRKNVLDFLIAIPKEKLSKASFRCQAYARSLMYLESHVREKSDSSTPVAGNTCIFENADVSSLMEIYSCLDEPDGLSGFASLSKSLSLQEQLLIDKKSGNWAEVFTACEQALQMEPTSVQRHSDVLNCLLNICHHQTMVTQVDGLISRVPEYKKTWCTLGVQAAWRLGKWDLMEEYLGGADEEGILNSSSDSNASFDRDLGKVLQAMMKKSQHSVAERLKMSKQALIAPLACAGMDSYVRAYPFVVKLHLLRELEEFEALFNGGSFSTTDEVFLKLVANWENRLRFTQSSLWTREPLLAFRRLVFDVSKFGAEVGNCWLTYAKLCRLAGDYELARTAIRKAQASGAPNVHMEKAKVLWITEHRNDAIRELQESLMNMLPKGVIWSSVISSIKTDIFSDKKEAAKTLLLYVKWIHYNGLKQKNVLELCSQLVNELHPWEKGNFHLAKYYDELYVDTRGCSALVRDALGWDYLYEGMYFYVQGLISGHKKLYQALPRLLTLWFEFANVYQKSGSAKKQELESIHMKIKSLMNSCLEKLPTYQWLTVLHQLVSRICHQNEETSQMVKEIITSVLVQFPQQGLWFMAGVSKSSVSARKDAAAEIIQGARKKSDGCKDMFVQFANLTDVFGKLCYLDNNDGSNSINIAAAVKPLKVPLDIIIPVQQSLTISLPAFDMNNSVFGSDLPTISGLVEEAKVLTSVTKPKKIILVGSDGIEYPFLFKSEHNHRKDALIMEFAAMLNHLLSKDPESRRRKLYIRTFAVVPLTKDSGILEWVKHTRGLRSILEDLYFSCGSFGRKRTDSKIREMYYHCESGKKSEMLKTTILPMLLPVFHKWFLTTFPEPTAWFRSRVAYARTTAVWSMVGHTVGLADRHGENILFDSTSGDCVHVDFDCIFDSLLLKPMHEMVPFRLTQNMIDGLGVTGYDGIFKRVCEITLTVLRTHRETLMSILGTIIDDPFVVEWRSSNAMQEAEVICSINAKLLVDDASIEDQASRLIADAVSLEHLAKMFHGWRPWY